MKKPRVPGKVPEPRQPRRRPSAVSRVFLWFFILFIAGAALAGGAAFYTYQVYTLPGPLAGTKVHEVGKGLGTPEIAASLQDAGIISDARVFSAMSYVTGTRTRLKAGEYEFPAEASMRDVMALIASGKSITYKLSVPEGWTSEMAVARVNANAILEGPPAAVPPEGSIMPDTYVFRRGMTRQKLVEDMQTMQAALLAELWDKRAPLLPFETKEEAVILASIVEKETGVADERPLVASVFMNRLKKNMRLQSDPTIIYGIAGGKGRLDRKLTRADIETTTPYNTYRINGLPPGPIANPGRAALEAVLNPQATDYLYFVADGSGGHAFAVTLEEHNANVRRWRQISGNAAAATAVEAGAEPAALETADGSLPADAGEQALVDAPAAEPPLPAAPPPELVPPAAPLPASAATAPEIADDALPPVVPQQVLPAPPPVSKPSPEEPSTINRNAAASPARPAAPKPGSVVTVAGRLVAIPKRNPRR